MKSIRDKKSIILSIGTIPRFQTLQGSQMLCHTFLYEALHACRELEDRFFMAIIMFTLNYLFLLAVSSLCLVI